jgi:glutamate/tyrosine decarboxylase-like PLP-dependent enzyme
MKAHRRDAEGAEEACGGSSSFSLTSEQRRRLGCRLIDQLDQWFGSLLDRPVQLPREARTYEPLANPLPEVGGDAERILNDTLRELVEQGFHVPSANYFGLMNPTPAYVAVLAETIVAALNPQLATMARSQLASKIEQETLRWIGERIWPGATEARVPGEEMQIRRFARDDKENVLVRFDGSFTSGGNEANFSGLAAALTHHFPASVENGVAAIGAQPLVYGSNEAHHSIDKSLGLLGIGRKALRRVAVNARVQMDVAALEKAIARDRAAGHRPFCVVATAGTTNSGAVDDIVAIADLCEREGLWLHVDGAYGAAAVMSAQHRELVRGIERADSVTVDPHKWLAMPFAAGVILTRRPEALRAAFAVATPYMPRAASGGPRPPVDNFQVSTQWSRRANALKLWLTLRVHGVRAYEEHFERQLQLARAFAEWVRGSREFELASEPMLTIVNLRARGRNDAEIAARNAEIVERVTADGRRWISDTIVDGRSVIRVMIISYLTEQRHVEELQQALELAATTA